MVPEGLFTTGLWVAYFGVGAGALYLLAALVKEWRDENLW